MRREVPPDGHLERLRRAELGLVRSWFSAGLRVLEIGGGNGFQAGVLATWGCEVTSLDLAGRPHPDVEHFPVGDYDGCRIPYPDGSFDVIFSSNVLEHVRSLPPLLDEMRRVMRHGAVAIHVLPSPAWRLWTSVSHYPYLLRRLLLSKASTGARPYRPVAQVVRRRGLIWSLRRALWAGPHGEYPSAASELYFYSRNRWRNVFHEHGFRLLDVTGNRLFYTGNIIHPSMSLSTRRALSRVLGSACNIFVMHDESTVPELLPNGSCRGTSRSVAGHARPRGMSR